MSKKRQYFVEYEVSYKGTVGPFEVDEINGIVNFDNEDERIDTAIDKQIESKFYDGITTSYHCQQCGVSADFNDDDETLSGKFPCECEAKS